MATDPDFLGNGHHGGDYLSEGKTFRAPGEMLKPRKHEAFPVAGLMLGHRL